MARLMIGQGCCSSDVFTTFAKVLKEATGEEISTRAMMDYFKPLMSWLEEQNKGRQIGWG